MSAAVPVAPFFEDLELGMASTAAPALTLTEGHAAVHQAIVGDRLRLPLDAGLCAEVIGPGPALAHPALVCDVAIGQSTLLTQRVIGNLFYRGLVLRHAPRIGDTLKTVTEVVALRQNRARAGRAATGLAVLRVRTRDQEGRDVLDFWRCAMLPLRDPEGVTGRDDDPAAIGADARDEELPTSIAGWRLQRFRDAVPGPHLDGLVEGAHLVAIGGDVVSAAPELARLSLNVATAHHDATASGRRLVYGGHTIGLACSQLARALPNLVTVVGWHSCDHLGPVHEGDTVRSEIEVERLQPLDDGGLAHLRVRTTATGMDGEEAPVLDWRLVGVLA